MQLFLIRHPAPLVDAGICYGASDLALAGDVAAAAERIRPQLPPAIPVFSSPLQRCHQLATLLHPAPVSDDRLREMHFGEWEMTPWQQIQRTALDGWAADPLGYTPPGGESVGAMQKRVGRFVAELALQDIARASLVTHAGVMKVLLGMARNLPTREWMALRFDYESVVTVTMPGSDLEKGLIP